MRKAEVVFWKVVHARHRALAEQILGIIPELRAEVAREMRTILDSGVWSELQDPSERHLGEGVSVKVTVKDRGDWLELHVKWPSNGGRELLYALLVGGGTAVGAFPPRDNSYGKYLTCCINGPDDELVCEYRDLKRLTGRKARRGDK